MSDKKQPEPYRFLSADGTRMRGTHASAVGAVMPVSELDTWLTANIRDFPVTLDLPPEYLNGISKVVTQWAFAEWLLMGTLGMLAGIDRKEGRVLFGVRLGDTVQKIKQMMDLLNAPLPANWSQFSQRVTECEKARNLVAHGVWMIDPDTGELCVQNPSGEWETKDENNKLVKASKRKYPEAKYVDEAWFADTVALIAQVTGEIHDLDRHIIAS